MPKEIIPVSGLHCRACETLITDSLLEVPGVKSARVDFKKAEAEVEFTDLTKLSDLHQAIKKSGYHVGRDSSSWFSRDKSEWRDLLLAALVVLILILLLSLFGFKLQPNIAGTPQSLLGVLLVGLAAGFSTCMALTGGLLLGLSAKYSAKHPETSVTSRLLPQGLFNFGRLVSYALLGGIIGLVGTALEISPLVWAILTLIVSFVMLILGLQLVAVFPRINRFSLTLPNWIKINKNEAYSHFGAVILGALTFFLPCGFTQAMQLYAVSSGSFLSGSVIMLVFAIGTLPGLLLAGLAGSLAKGIWGQRLFKLIGILIIVFALYNLANSWNLLGVTNWFSKDASACSTQDQTAGVCPLVNPDLVQVIKVTYTQKNDIIPSTITVKVNEPVRLEINPLDSASGCMSTIMIPGLYNKAIRIIKDESIVMEFTPTKIGTYPITCAMGVKRGELVVE